MVGVRSHILCATSRPLLQEGFQQWGAYEGTQAIITKNLFYSLLSLSHLPSSFLFPPILVLIAYNIELLFLMY